jgi:hypothetical protein
MSGERFWFAAHEKSCFVCAYTTTTQLLDTTNGFKKYCVVLRFKSNAEK